MTRNCELEVSRDWKWVLKFLIDWTRRTSLACPSLCIRQLQTKWKDWYPLVISLVKL